MVEYDVQNICNDLALILEFNSSTIYFSFIAHCWFCAKQQPNRMSIVELSFDQLIMSSLFIRSINNIYFIVYKHSNSYYRIVGYLRICGVNRKIEKYQNIYHNKYVYIDFDHIHNLWKKVYLMNEHRMDSIWTMMIVILLENILFLI